MTSSIGSATSTAALWTQMEQKTAENTINQINQEQQETVQENNDIARASGSDVETITP